MKTADRVQQLMQLPVSQVPRLAIQLEKFLSSKYGARGEIFCSAYEAYAIVCEQTEGGKCDEESRRFLAAIEPEPDLLTALQEAHRALQFAADHIHSREGYSVAYFDAARGLDAAHEAIIRALRGPHA